MALAFRLAMCKMRRMVGDTSQSNSPEASAAVVDARSLIAALGGTGHVAGALDYSRGTVDSWASRNVIPLVAALDLFDLAVEQGQSAITLEVLHEFYHAHHGLRPRLRVRRSWPKTKARRQAAA